MNKIIVLIVVTTILHSIIEIILPEGKLKDVADGVVGFIVVGSVIEPIAAIIKTIIN